MLILKFSEYAELERKGIGFCLFCSSLIDVSGKECENCGSNDIIPLEQALDEEKMILEE